MLHQVLLYVLPFSHPETHTHTLTRTLTRGVSSTLISSFYPHSTCPHTQSIYGTIKPLPEFARQQQGLDHDMADAGEAAAAAAAAAAGQAPGTAGGGPFLVAWELQADQGMAQVLLLARAAHCLHRLHAVDAGRQQVAGTAEWQVGTAGGMWPRGGGLFQCFVGWLALLSGR